MARIADELDVSDGRELIREGERGRQFFVLTSGAAEVRRRGRMIAAMKKGDFFGELALVSDRPTSAAVTATKPSTVLVVTDTAFRGLLRDYPGVQLKVLQALAERIAD